MGRRKLDSVELDDKPAESHVARTDQDQYGKIFRRNMPYGTVTDHGTMFVGFSADSGAFPKCWRAWQALVPECETRSRALRSRSVVPIISFRRPMAWSIAVDIIDYGRWLESWRLCEKVRQLDHV
jgi:hypothetical protein